MFQIHLPPSTQPMLALQTSCKWESAQIKILHNIRNFNRNKQKINMHCTPNFAYQKRRKIPAIGL